MPTLTVDRLSRGRLVLGIGGGDDPAEALRLGMPRPNSTTRLRDVEEALSIVRGLWSRGPFTFICDQFNVTEAVFGPGPVQTPDVPVLIAGSGEATLRQVACYAGASNFGAHERMGAAFTIDSIRDKLKILRGQCDAVGRPCESLFDRADPCGSTGCDDRDRAESLQPGRSRIRSSTQLLFRHRFRIHSVVSGGWW